MIGTIIELLGNMLKLAVMVYREVAARQEEARKANKEFIFSQEVFDACVTSALTKMRLQAAKESEQARKIDNDVDRELNERKK